MDKNQDEKVIREIKAQGKMIDNVFERFDELNERVDRVENDIVTIKRDIKSNHETVMNALDSISSMLQDRRDEEAAGTVWLRRHNEEIADHEGRIRKLERVAA